MHTIAPGEKGEPPKDFETFKFVIDKAPNDPFEIYHIPSHIMYKQASKLVLTNVILKCSTPILTSLNIQRWDSTSILESQVTIWWSLRGDRIEEMEMMNERLD